jgi:hypothetical protein
MLSNSTVIAGAACASTMRLDDRLTQRLAFVVASHATVGARVHEVVTLLSRGIELRRLVTILAERKTFLVPASVMIVVFIVAAAGYSQRQRAEQKESEATQVHVRPDTMNSSQRLKGVKRSQSFGLFES